MKLTRLQIGFIATLIVAIVLRVFVIDVVSVSNDLLQPDFYPGDFVLVSKISSPEESKWFLIKDIPQKSAYSIRKLTQKQGDGWMILDPLKPEEKTYAEKNQLKGRAFMILWSLPCKPEAVANGLCPDKTSRFLKQIN